VVTVTDASPSPQSFNANYNVTIVDPNGPFGITNPNNGIETIPGGGGSTSLYTANPNPTPNLGVGLPFTPINWVIDSISPHTPGITLTNATGQSTAINFAANVPPLPANGTYNIVLRATDSSCGSFKHTATYNISITNTGAPIITSPDSLLLTGATLCANYSQLLQVTGGTAPFSWSVDPSTPLPPGLTINPLGQNTAQITGIPTLPATGPGGNVTYTIKINVTDSAPTQQTGTRTYSLGVTDPDGPFVITGDGSQELSGATPNGSDLTAAINKQGAGAPTWTPIYWSLVGAPAQFSIVSTNAPPPNGNPAHLHYDNTVPLAPGQYDVVVRAIDSPPCVSPSNPGVHHQAEFTVTVTINGP